jgi:hypothetical protein
MEDVLKFRVGKCGSCGLTLRFWPVDGSHFFRTNVEKDQKGRIMDKETIESWSEAEAILIVDALVDAGCVAKKDFDKAVGIVAEEIWVRLLCKYYPPQKEDATAKAPD